MKFSRVLNVLLITAVIIAVAGCSATPTRRSFKEGWKDSVVSTKVKFELMKDKLVKKRNIDVDTWRGVVTMTGRVTSMEEKERAEQLAWQAKGVRGVDNFLQLVTDAYAEPTEVVATKVKKTPKEKFEIKEKITIEEDVVVTKTTPTHPIRSTEPTVKNRVDGPIVYEDTIKTQKKFTARRGRYTKPTSSNIDGADLTSEEALAQEAAEELQRLRGEDIAD